MIQAPDKPQRDKPWDVYRHEPNWKLLTPGWGGSIDSEELSFIVKHLENDLSLRAWWGMPGRWKRVPEEVVWRLAMEGSDENQSHNRMLARPRRQSRAAA